MRASSSCLSFAALYGLILAANGLSMHVAPVTRYDNVSGVPATGPFNQHILREIGLIFALLAGAVLVGGLKLATRSLLWSAIAVWLAGHALFHIWEVLVGICAPYALARNFPGVSLTAIFASRLVLWARREMTSARKRHVLT